MQRMDPNANVKELRRSILKMHVRHKKLSDPNLLERSSRDKILKEQDRQKKNICKSRLKGPNWQN